MRLLLVAPTYYGYDAAIAGAFERLHHEVELRSYYPHTTLTQKVLNRITEEVLPRVGATGASRCRRDSFNASVLLQASRFRPDAILVVKGDILRPETTERLSNIAPCMYWGYDDPYRYPDVVESLPFYCTVASFSRADTARLNRDGLNGVYVPLGFDEAVFGGNAGTPPASIPDVSFIGARYPRREALLTEVAECAEVGIWGGDWKRRPWRKRFYERRNKLDQCARGSAGLTEASAIYSSTPVNVNIHGDWDGLNMRVFEIPGAGGFQLCDAAAGIDECFEPDKEIVLFSNAEEMVEKLRFYLTHDASRTAIAAAGHRRALAEHKLRDRASLLLEALEAARTL